MNKIFNIYNKRGRVGWFVAQTEQRALELAFERGHAKKLENLTAKELDLGTLRRDGHGRPFDGWDEMLRGSEGQASLHCQAIPFADLMSSLKTTGKPPETQVGKWVVS